MANKKWFNALVMWLTIIGALAWGLWALGFDLVGSIFRTWDTWIYGAVGVAGAIMLLRQLGVIKK